MNHKQSRREADLSLLPRKDMLIQQDGAAGSPVAAPGPPISGRQIVFIDGAVPDARLLAAGVGPGVVAVMLDPGGNELQQIAGYLASHDIRNLAAIDIVAHGSDGTLKLGGTILDTETIPQYAGDLAAIGAALQPGGAIQLYGCDVAQDAAGVAFLQQLSDAAGGASVAAASHPVGAASGGGSWTLNVDVGTINVGVPFTAVTLADYQGELASSTGDLWIGSWHSLITGSLNQIDVVGVSGSTALGTTEVANGLDSGDAALNHPTGLAADPARGEVFVVNAGLTIYAMPPTGGALTQIYAAPDSDPREATGFIGGIVADEASDSLYFTQSDYNLDTNAQIPSDTGVFSMDENGNGLTQLVYDITGGVTLYNPTSLGLDLANNLAFFIENDAYAGGTGAVDLEVGTLARHNFAQLLQIGDFATGFEINTGLAVDTVNQEIYYSIENYYTPSENGIYSVHYTLSGSLASVGTVTTLYSGAAAEAPEAIAIDPANGLLYVSGEVPLGSGYTGAAWVGSLSGSAEAPLTQIFQLSTDASNTTATFADTAFFEAAPTVSAGGTVSFAQDGPAVALDPALSVTDESEPDLAGATVSINSGFLTGDTLNFADQNGITGTYDATSGVLTFSGTASVADYQAVLGAVSYSFSGDPTDGGTDPDRTIAWSVSDGIETSGVATSSLTVCFLAGTRIATPSGAVPVEQLAAGDLVLTQSGASRPVRWIGHRRLDLTRHPAPDKVQPVLIHAGAFADEVPHRDLFLSPDHAVLRDGLLIPARLLVNGASIRRDTRRRMVTYFHVELDAHDILLAENLPAESYLDTGNRDWFENAGVPLLLHPDFAHGQARREAGSCLPFADDPERVEPVWSALAKRAAQLGWQLPQEPQTTLDPALHLMVDGRRVAPLGVESDRYVFVLPGTGAAVRLVSHSASPRETRPWVSDDRRLGVLVGGLAFRFAESVLPVPLDHPEFGEGWWQPERHGPSALCRWTNGNARVPMPVADLQRSGPCLLEVQVAATLAYRSSRANGLAPAA